VSYLVLARKYRPQLFEDLVGQEHVARTLTNAIRLDRVHHAYLFTGARGVGKTSAARILAKALCCVQGPTATPCGVCDFCREIVSGHSVDVVEIDGASNRGVDDARTLREAVRYAPSKGRKKVTIIDEVHMFTTEAFNALLKTLEEPPPHVVFILATTEVHKIPVTILSRCQRYDFKLIPTVRLVEHLGSILTQEKIAFEPEGLRLLARQAAGSVRDALSLLDQMIAYVGDAPISHDKVVEVLGVADRRLLAGLFQAVQARDAASALRLLGEAIDRGIDLVQLSRAFLGFIHDVEIAAVAGGGGDLLDVTVDELAELRQLAEKTPKGLCGSLFDRWMRAVEEAGKSATPRLLLEMALVDLCFTEPLLPLGDLLGRLEEMEQRLGRGGGGPPRGGGSPPGPERFPDPARVRPEPTRSAPPAAPSSSPPPAPGAPRSVAPSVAAVASASAIAPTAPPARPAITPGAANGGVEDGWSRLRLRMQERPALAAALDHAAVDAWEAGKVVLSFADRLPLEATEKGRKLIEAALVDLCGAPTTLHLKMGTGANAPVVRAETVQQAESQASDRQRREEEARKHPMIRKAEEVFGIAAREIKVS
jgi:DNA polymerase-3 subunit gamma/tau